jgi:hypothetical protein
LKDDKTWQVALVDPDRQQHLEELSAIVHAFANNPLTELVIESLAYCVDDDGSSEHFDTNLALIENLLRRLIQISEALQDEGGLADCGDDIPF